MGLLVRISGKPLREHAAYLVRVFSERCPPPQSRQVSLSARKVDGALDRFYREAASFRREQRLGIIGRARYAKACQDALLDKGYPADLVKKITSALSAASLASGRADGSRKTKNPRP